MAEKAGGPAFPQFYSASGKAVDASPGMTLRDYFAAQALPQAIAHALAVRQNELRPGDFRFDSVARSAYEMADAMLAERERA